MGLLNRQVWINFLGLVPSTLVTVLAIAVAFLRFYDEQDFPFLGFVAQPQLWSNRLTVAALLAALANFSVEWNRRNRETDRLAEARDREAEAREREAEARGREAEARGREARRNRQEARRNRLEVQCFTAQIRYQLEPNQTNRQALMTVLARLEEYSQTLGRGINSG
jgi:hypothetical protein